MGRVSAMFRRFQQTYAYHALLAAAGAAFTGALRAYSAPDASTASIAAAMASAFVFTFCLSIQEGPGSSNYHADGTPNAAVANVVLTQKASEAGVPGASDAAMRVAAVAQANARSVIMAGAAGEVKEPGSSCP